MTKVDELELPHVDIFGLVHDDLHGALDAARAESIAGC